ncbi:uncharacterized protein TNCV_4373431 [Trichonephila clavipes]|uniref:Uncharacterized protein n=1 Tax=Trichonephila clavipes TaxID=2585209 RepID=A0A8X6R3T1_TRICX|nr:uncharacterized protein TNCV_4373431 [Trichonephila clavipes]
MACQVTRSFANRACLGRAGKATAAVPRYRRINCADAKTMAGSSTRGKNGESPIGPSKGLVPEPLPPMADRMQTCVNAERVYFEDIWILSDIRSSIHYLSEWWRHGDRKTKNVIQLLSSLSVNVKIFYQWATSHLNFCGNKSVDGLDREGSHEDYTLDGCLTFSELLPGSNKISVPLGSRPPYMSGMKTAVLELLCLKQAVDKMKLLLLGFTV